MSTVITRGMRMPAPAACTSRPSSSTTKLGPQPARKLPNVKITMDTRKSRLVVKRSVKKAVMGIMMAFTSVKPVQNRHERAEHQHGQHDDLLAR